MKYYLLFVLGLTFSGQATTALAQSKNQAANKSHSSNQSNDPLFRKTTTDSIRYQAMIDTLFIYPRGSVVYRINGKQFININQVRRLISQRRDAIEKVVKKGLDQTGRQIIEINYKQP